MIKFLPSLKEAAGILNSVLIVIFIPAIIENIYIYVTAVNTGPLFLYSSLILYLAIKSFLFAGIFVSMAEIITGSKILLTFGRFMDNALRFWGIYLLLSILSILIYFGLSLAVLPQHPLFQQTISSGLNICVNIIFLIHVINKNFFHTTEKSRKSIAIPTSHALLIAFLYIFEWFMRSNVIISLPYQFYTAPLLSLALLYFHFWTGLTLMLFIKNNSDLTHKLEDEDKEIYLINPIGSGIFFGISSLFLRGQYPAFFSILKALTPQGYRFREFTRTFWYDRYYAKNKLVAITCYTPNSYEAYTIAKGFKRRGSKVIMGGPHVSFFPNEALEYCDSVVIGEAEAVWEEIVEDYENDRLKTIYERQPEPKHYERVYQKLLHFSPDIIKHNLETTSGCKFKCDFCAIPGLFNRRVRNAPVNHIVSLIKKILPRFKRFTFIDNNIYNDPAYAKELFTALKPLKINWSSQCTIDIAKNDTTLQLAKESGCKLLCCGFEISNRSLEKKQKGKFSLAEHYLELVKRVKQKGIGLKANFIFGFDSDSIGSLLRLWLFIFKIRPNVMTLFILTPMPGSKVFLDMLNSGRITNLNWRQYACSEFLFTHEKLNTPVLNFLYPIIYSFYFITTSTMGLIIGFIVIFSLINMFLINAISV